MGVYPDVDEEEPLPSLASKPFEDYEKQGLYAIFDQFEEYHEKCQFCHKECDNYHKHYCQFE